MTRKEIFEIIANLHEKHGEDFKRWYDTASYPTIEDYCEIGFLLDRFYE